MTRLSRYVARTVLYAILGVLLVVVALDAMAAIIDEVGDIRGEYTFLEVLKYVGTTLPGSIYQNIPFAALIGCLVGLGLLASNSELVVMRGAGISLLRIAGFVLRPVLGIILVGVLLGEYAVPYTDQLAEGRRALLLGKQDRMASVSGLWNKERNEYIHVNVVFPNGNLFGVSRYRFEPDGTLDEVSFSSSATFLGGNRGWLEERGYVTRFRERRTETDEFERRRWDSDLSPQLLRLVQMEPASLPIRDLYQYASYLENQGQSSGKHWLAFWQKSFQPLTTLSLVLIAISFIFGPLRESTTGFRIFAGVVTGIVFSTSQDMLGPASLVYGFPPLWSVIVPVVVSVVIGLFLLRRAG